MLREAQSSSLVVGCCLLRYFCSASIAVKRGVKRGVKGGVKRGVKRA